MESDGDHSDQSPMQADNDDDGNVDDQYDSSLEWNRVNVNEEAMVNHDSSSTTSASTTTSTDKKSDRIKRMPTFTIILRKLVQFNFFSDPGDDQEEENADANSQKDGAEDTESSEDELYVSCDEHSSDVDDDLDCPLLHCWQMWTLQESPSCWNVELYGGPQTTSLQFWETYSSLNDKMNCKDYTSLMIFRQGVEPKWEDPANVNGGRWFYDVNYDRYESESRTDCLLHPNIWTRTMQMVIGGQLGNELIVGMVLNLKANKYRVSLWTRSVTDSNCKQIIQLGLQMHKELMPGVQLKFELHSCNSIFNLAQYSFLSPEMAIPESSDSQPSDIVTKVTINTDGTIYLSK